MASSWCVPKLVAFQTGNFKLSTLLIYYLKLIIAIENSFNNLAKIIVTFNF